MNPFKNNVMERVFDRLHARHEHHHPEHRHHHHMGRHGGRHPHGFFGFGPEFGGDRFSGGGMGAFGPGRKLSSADLQLLLLALLAEKPSHGYELIKSLDERSNGYYSPSPGMVYPALTYLEEIGHATVQTEGTKKRYQITETGLSHLEDNRSAVDTLLQQLNWLGQRMDHLRRAMAGGVEAVDEGDFDAAPPHGGRAGRHGGSTELRMARRALKSALIEKAGAGADEQRRIAAILERAIAEIRDGRGEA